MKNNIDEILKNKLNYENDLNDISEDFIPEDETTIKKFKEKLLNECNISVDTYLRCFAKINRASFIGTIKNPLEFYILLGNTNVIGNPYQLDGYREINAMLWNFLIDNYAYIYLNNLNESLIVKKGCITLEQFMEVYNIFEEIKGCKVDSRKNKFYELIKFLSEVNVQTRNSEEMMNLINMKAELKSYIDSYKQEHSKKKLNK